MSSSSNRFGNKVNKDAERLLNGHHGGGISDGNSYQSVDDSGDEEEGNGAVRIGIPSYQPRHMPSYQPGSNSLANPPRSALKKKLSPNALDSELSKHFTDIQMKTRQAFIKAVRVKDTQLLMSLYENTQDQIWDLDEKISDEVDSYYVSKGFVRHQKASYFINVPNFLFIFSFIAVIAINLRVNYYNASLSNRQDGPDKTATTYIQGLADFLVNALPAELVVFVILAAANYYTNNHAHTMTNKEAQRNVCEGKIRRLKDMNKIIADVLRSRNVSIDNQTQNAVSFQGDNESSGIRALQFSSPDPHSRARRPGDRSPSSQSSLASQQLSRQSSNSVPNAPYPPAEDDEDLLSNQNAQKKTTVASHSGLGASLPLPLHSNRNASGNNNISNTATSDAKYGQGEPPYLYETGNMQQSNATRLKSTTSSSATSSSQILLGVGGRGMVVATSSKSAENSIVQGSDYSNSSTMLAPTVSRRPPSPSTNNQDDGVSQSRYSITDGRESPSLLAQHGHDSDEDNQQNDSPSMLGQGRSKYSPSLTSQGGGMGANAGGQTQNLLDQLNLDDDENAESSPPKPLINNSSSALNSTPNVKDTGQHVVARQKFFLKAAKDANSNETRNRGETLKLSAHYEMQTLEKEINELKLESDSVYKNLCFAMLAKLGFDANNRLPNDEVPARIFANVFYAFTNFTFITKRPPEKLKELVIDALSLIYAAADRFQKENANDTPMQYLEYLSAALRVHELTYDQNDVKAIRTANDSGFIGDSETAYMNLLQSIESKQEAILADERSREAAHGKNEGNQYKRN